MKNLLNQTKKIIIRKLFDESYQDYEKWDYNSSLPKIGEVSGTNGVEASADELMNLPVENWSNHDWLGALSGHSHGI